MAKPKVQTQARAWPWPVQLALDLANGQHERSGDLVTAAWISEISLIVLIIRNIACTAAPSAQFFRAYKANKSFMHRYRDRLGRIHGTDRPIR